MPADLRPTLRERAGGRCEYCQLPERFAVLRFQQDHIVARKHRGPLALENLAWACADCNAHKGSNLSGIDPQSGALDRLFHPRVDRWAEHFRWDGPELRGLSTIGRVTVAVLQINREDRITLRREIMMHREESNADE
jgi:hypothetical protein